MSAPDKDGTLRYMDLYFGGIPHVRHAAGESPQAFLAHLQPDETVRAHFHRVDQYQLFFGSPGSLLQRTDIAPDSVLVQYADAYSTYGPFSSGRAGMDFFTLRAVGDNFVAYMPGSSHLLVRKRHRVRQVAVEAEGHRLLSQSQSTVEVLFDDPADDLSCLLYRGGSGASIVDNGNDSPGGWFQCIIGGSIQTDAGTFGPKSLRWSSGGGGAGSELRAGSAGCSMLALRYPCPPSAGELPADLA